MKVAMGADHGGYALKEEIKQDLIRKGYEVTDFGTYSEDSVDYNEIAATVSEKVASKEFDRGILCCGTGIGMSIMANKVDGVRCALTHDLFTAKATREHNNTNVLAMGGRVIGPGLAIDIANVWLETKFSEAERHQRRIDKISKYNG